MARYELIWSFDTANYRVEYCAAPDDDLDLSWDDDGSTAEGLESGKFCAFVARVQVLHRDTEAVLGEDYLGGCIYESPGDFIDHRGCRADPSKNYGSYFSDMVREAVRQSREHIAKAKHDFAAIHA